MTTLTNPMLSLPPPPKKKTMSEAYGILGMA